MLKTEYKVLLKELAGFNLSAIGTMKYFKDWRKSWDAGRSPVTDRVPWITYVAIGFLNQYLKPAHVVFEYGGGGSTLYFLDRVKQVVTVEHDKEWFHKLKENITASGLEQKWNGNLILPEVQLSNNLRSQADPQAYFSGDSEFANHTFKNYASFIDKFPDNHFDVVLVDGRARASCIMHAVKKIKKGGILVLDNSDREYYLAKTAVYLSGMKKISDQSSPIPYMNFFGKTTIWIKTYIS